MQRFALVALVIVALVASSSLANRALAGTTDGVSHARAPRALDGSSAAARDAETRGHMTSAPVVLRQDDGAKLMAFPPATTHASRSLTVIYLHGARGRVENGCPWFRSGASELGWLVCPEAIESEPDGSWSWGADVFEQGPVVKRALRAAVANGASNEPGVAVGFSQGSYVALDLVRARLAKFRGLVLLGAELHPNAKTLRDAGVTRIALGAGSFDATHDSLVEEAKRLDSEGIDTRFFELGAIGHAYTVESTTVLRDAIAWAGGA